jgi:GMP synthase-like glutamine amidotransferase
VRALILQFEAGDPPELLGDHWCKAGVGWDVVRMDLPHAPLTLEGYDMLIGLGGSMGVNDAARLPFLTEAMSAIREAVRRDLPYLGICLGGQLLAAALGAAVRRAAIPEIGVIQVSLHEDADDPLLRGFDRTFETVQFHEDIYNVPSGGTLLASSADCRTQIARCGARAYALQFHPEVSAETFACWLEEGYAQATGDHDVRSREAVLACVRRHEEAIHRGSARLFDNFIELVVSAPVGS